MTSDGRGAVDGLRTAGSRAWALLGVLAVVAVAVWVLSWFGLVLVAAGIALFPAALLSPVAGWLRGRGVPAAVVALGLLLALVGFVAGTVWLLVPRFAAELPALGEAFGQGLDAADRLLPAGTLPDDATLESVGRRAFEALGGSGGLVGQGVEAARTLAHLLTGIALGLVALFFYLKDGRAIWSGIADLLPGRRRGELDRVADQLWWTLGAYLRGQLLVALFDAVFIGLGLLLLGVPLALPLAVVVFFGALFPIVGAFVSGLLAVLVALATGGLTSALLVLGLIVLVQQVEGNLFEPLILSKVIALHPLAVILAVAGGAVAFGILGAFLAVPAWACTARVVDHLRGRRPPAGPLADPDDGDGAEPVRQGVGSGTSRG